MEGFTCVRCDREFYQDEVVPVKFYYDTRVGEIVVNCCPGCGVSKCGEYISYFINRDWDKRKTLGLGQPPFDTIY